MPIRSWIHSTTSTTTQLRELIRKQLVHSMLPSCTFSNSSLDSSLINQQQQQQQHVLKTTLYSFPPSTCSWRVRAALYHHLPILSKFISHSCNDHHDESINTNVNICTTNTTGAAAATSTTANGESNNNDGVVSRRISSDYEKYIKNQIVNIDLFTKMNEKDEYNQVNPMKQVPALELKNQDLRILLTQSLPIIGFLDNLAEVIVQEETSILGQTLHSDYHYLIPRNDLFLTFRTNQLSEIVNSGIQPYQNIKLLRKIPKEVRGEDNKLWVGEWQRNGLNQIEELIAEDYRDYSIQELTELANNHPIYFVRGYNKLSMADLFLVPSIEAAISRSDINMAKEFPYSFAIYSSLKDLDIFSQSRNN